MANKRYNIFWVHWTQTHHHQVTEQLVPVQNIATVKTGKRKSSCPYEQTFLQQLTDINSV